MYKSKHTGEEIDRGIDAMQYVTNPNLLDNWYFVNPVNQRGQTEHEGGAYGIDRWYVRPSTRLSIEEDGVVYGISDTKTTTARLLMQAIENHNELAGKTVTFSVLLSEVSANTQKVYIGIGYASVISGLDDFYASTRNSATSTAGLYTITATLPNTLTKEMLKVSIGFTNGGSELSSCKIVAAKLELGSQQTLAHQDESGNWVLNEIPNYAEELAKCQTCLIPWGESNRVPSTLVTANIIDFIVPVPVTMRATPAIDTSLLAVCSLDGTAQSGFTFSNVTVETGFIRIRATKTSHGLSAACLYPTTKVFFDANL